MDPVGDGRRGAQVCLARQVWGKVARRPVKRREVGLRLLTKAQACRELDVSLSTLDRRIAAGELLTQREAHGRRHRLYVVLDDGAAADHADADRARTALAVAQERVRCLEEQGAFLRGQLELEQRRSAELLEDLRLERAEGRRRWWRLW